MGKKQLQLLNLNDSIITTLWFDNYTVSNGTTKMYVKNELIGIIDKEIECVDSTYEFYRIKN